MKRWLVFLKHKLLGLPLWQKLFIGLFVIMLLMRWMFADYVWRVQHEATVDGIDRELLITCFEAVPIIGEDFHDSLPHPPAGMTPEAFDAKVERLTALSDGGETDTDAIYTVFRDGDEYVFGIGSVRDDATDPHQEVIWGQRWQLPPLAALETAYDKRRIVAESYTDEGGNYRTVFVPLENDKGEVYLVCADIEMPSIEEHFYRDMTEGAVLGAVILVVSLLMIVLTWASVSRPMKRIVGFTEKLIENKFTAEEKDVGWLRRVALRRQDEVGRLAGSIQTMQNVLSVYIEHIQSVAEEQGRVAAEILAASGIQLSMLPSPLHERHADERRVVVAGLLEPAGDVGGDFYDFELIGGRYLYIAVGDVAGRGIPSAMLMAIVRTQLRTLLHATREDPMAPSAMLQEVNASVKHRQRAGLFISLLCGLLDLRDGTLRYVNAGVVAPWLIGADGSCRELGGRAHPPVGVLDDMTLEDGTVTLAPGDKVVFATNGAMWARNAAGDIFDTNGMRETIQANAGLAPAELNQALRAAIFEHLQLEEQADDLALLTMRYVGADS